MSSSTGPTLNMAEAARACGVSVSTLRRRRDALEAHGATRHDGSWVIPIATLVSLGLMPKVTPPDAPSPDGLTPVMTGQDDAPVTALKEALAEAERRAAAAEQRAAVAEAVANERERIISSQALSLRLLEAGPAPGVEHAEPSSTPEPVPVADELPRRRRWWHRS